MKNTVSLILLFCFLITQPGQSQSDCKEFSSRKNIKIVFYNVENLFDTIDDPAKDDKEFLPDSKVYWNTERYNNKLENLSKVLTSIDPNNFPAIIGLSEIENKSVLEDLIKKTDLEKGKYKIIHHESPDERGIDVGLIYRKKKFIPIEQQFISVQFPTDLDDKTREILYVKGSIKKDTLHCFVNHWPSRWGGQEKSEPKRMYVAKVLKSKVDSILSKNLMANIVIIGDFNDEPDNKSIKRLLKAKKVDKTIYPGMLYNLMYQGYEEGKGSYYYWRDKKWNMLDQIIVSGSLLTNEKGLTVPELRGCIFKPEWILYENEDGIKQPARTKGKTYYGGYSDHLPVYFNLLIK
ncbi:MAG: hypothetical protein K8S00_03035 [Bacteroidales bacterium]|nr:hypothetical protein [Bacteroidales bacterium]